MQVAIVIAARMHGHVIKARKKARNLMIRDNYDSYECQV